MTDFEISLLLTFSWVLGIILGYVLWAPDTNLKRGVINGLSFRFIWGIFVK